MTKCAQIAIVLAASIAMAAPAAMAQPQQVGAVDGWTVWCETATADRPAGCAIDGVVEQGGARVALRYRPAEDRVVLTDQGGGEAVLRIDGAAPVTGACQDKACAFAGIGAALERGTSLTVLLSAPGRPSLVAQRALSGLGQAATLARDWLAQRAGSRAPAVDESKPPGAATSQKPGARPGAKQGESGTEWMLRAGAPRPGSKEKKIGEAGVWAVLCDLAVADDRRKCTVESTGVWANYRMHAKFAPEFPGLFAFFVEWFPFTMSGSVDGGQVQTAKCNRDMGYLCYFDDPAFYIALQSGTMLSVQLEAVGKPPFKVEIKIDELRRGSEIVTDWLARPPAQR